MMVNTNVNLTETLICYLSNRKVKSLELSRELKKYCLPRRKDDNSELSGGISQKIIM